MTTNISNQLSFANLQMAAETIYPENFTAGAIDSSWLTRGNNHLEVRVIGPADLLRLNNWYLGSQYQTEQFLNAEGSVLANSQVQSLVNAMAAFSPPAQGQTTLPPTYQNALGGVIAAAWQ